ncbi:MAG: hypothetical protein IBJ12_00060 [Sphingomonadaceae bacterium]|nr:hypothetical protein [Sphingomonadaceae bacterium]
MRWIKDIRLSALAVVGFLVLLPVDGAHAEPIVIKYEGPASQTYKPGKRLPSTSKINLKSGEILTVLDERGTRVLRGPGTFNASSSANAANISSTSLATLVRTSTVRRARTGAVRGDAAPARASLSPNLWYLDYGKGGQYCVADFQNLRLWRPDSSDSKTLTATDKKTGKMASVKLGKGANTVNWPSEIAPADGGIYAVSGPDKAEHLISLVKIDVTGNERIDILAAKLIDHGCMAQSELLAATFAQNETLGSAG